MGCATNCGFGTITVTCVTPSYPVQATVCSGNGPGNLLGSCASFPNAPSPFAYGFQNNPALFNNLGLLLTIPVIGDIPIVYIGTQVSNAISKTLAISGSQPLQSTALSLQGGTVIAQQNQFPQNPQNALIHYNSGGLIEHLLPPTFPTGATLYYVWGLCNEYEIEATPWTNAEFQANGCESTITTPNLNANDDKIVIFYDITSMSSSIINKASNTVANFLQQYNFTNDVFEYKLGGERYLQWPTALVQPSSLAAYLNNGVLNGPSISYYTNPSIASGPCVVNNGLFQHSANPLGPGPHEDVLCLVFCDESAWGIYYGYNNDTSSLCYQYSMNQQGLVNNYSFSHLGGNALSCENTPANTASANKDHAHVWKAGWLQALSSHIGGYLDTDYRDYLEAYDNSQGGDNFQDNNIRTIIFAECEEPNPNNMGYGSTPGNKKKAMTQHLARMFGGNNISQLNDYITNFSAPFNFSPSYTVKTPFDNPPTGSNPQGYSFHGVNDIGPISGGFTNYHDRYVSPTPGGNGPTGSPPNSHDEDSYCKLDQIAENILGPGSDWSLKDRSITPAFMGTGASIYNQHYRPANDTPATPWNDMTIVTVDTLGNTLSPGFWPNRLFYELYRQIFVSTGTPTTTTILGCGQNDPNNPCGDTCHVDIRVFRDVDGDCERDLAESLISYIDIAIEDPQGNITIHNTSQFGSIQLTNIPVGVYNINGKVCDFSSPCMTYSCMIPLYETTFTNSAHCVLGCTNPNAVNYNPLATVDDGSCELPGCMHECAINYDPDANIEDGTCCPCLELEYIVEESVRGYAHEIQLTIEWPLNSSNFGGSSTASPPGSTLAAGLSTTTYGAPLIIYQDTFIYDPVQGIIGPNGAILGLHRFNLILDKGNLILDAGSCELSSYCWIVRWDVTSNEPALAFDNAAWTNIQMGKFKLSAYDNNSLYVYVPFEDGWVFMGNAIGGIPWPQSQDLYSPQSYQNYLNFLDNYYQGNVPWHLAGGSINGGGGLSSFAGMNALFWGAIGWATNWFHIAISEGVDWLSQNGGVVVTQNSTGGGVTVTIPDANQNVSYAHGPIKGINDQGFNAQYANVCGDPPDGCTDPLALNYNPAAGVQYTGNPTSGYSGQQGACVYECVEIIVELYFTAVRVFGTTKQIGSIGQSGSWSYKAVTRDETLPANPQYGWYNGIPLKEMGSGDFANDVKFQLLDEQNNVVYESGIITHPDTSTGGWRLRWGCYDENGAFVDTGAIAGISETSLAWNSPNLTGIQPWQHSMGISGWSLGANNTGTTTSSGLGIGIGNEVMSGTNQHLYQTYRCEALVPCAEDPCYKFKRVGTWEKGWESIGVNITILVKGANGNINIPLTANNPYTTAVTNRLADYHIPPGWYKLNLTKWGGLNAPNSVWATNWENEREVVFAVNYQSGANPFIGDTTTFQGQYWSLWGCVTPGSNIPVTGGTGHNSGNPGHSPRLGCTDPFSDRFDFFATESDGLCRNSRTYTEFTTLKVTVQVGGSTILKSFIEAEKFESTNSNIGQRPYDTGTRQMTEDQRNSKRKLNKVSTSGNFFEFVIKRNPDENEEKLEDGVQTNMEFGRVLEKDVKAGGKYMYEIDVPYGENVSFDIIDNFGRDLEYKIEQTGIRKRINKGPKKL